MNPHDPFSSAAPLVRRLLASLLDGALTGEAQPSTRSTRPRTASRTARKSASTP